MLRHIVVFALLSCLAAAGWAQSSSTPTTPAPPAPGKSAKKPVAKATSSVKPSTKPSAVAENGPCSVGVISAIPDIFAVQKMGLTVFGNALHEIPVTWNFDDLAVARAQAAAGTTSIRRIIYAKGAFDSYYHPQRSLFRNQREELTNLIRQITTNSSCERYLVVMRGEGQLPGTNQLMTGVGVANRGVGVISSSFLFAYISVIVFDGQSFEIQRDPDATLEGVFRHMADNLVENENMRTVDNSAFPENASDAAGSAFLRDNARGLLTRRLDKMLPAYFRK
jgi:hypothetical protein